VYVTIPQRVQDHMWPLDPEGLVEHYADAGVDPLALIDILAADHTTLRVSGDFVLLSDGVVILDAPVSLTGIPTGLTHDSRVQLALAAWTIAPRANRVAYAQGRAANHNASGVHRSVARRTAVVHEIPYVLSIAARVLRPDLQRFVAAVAFRLVTAAPTHDAINGFVEECIAAPIRFDLHTPAWESCATLFTNMACSGQVVRNTVHATLVVDGIGIETTRRDIILLVLAMMFASDAPLPDGIAVIAARRSWLDTVAPTHHVLRPQIN
jgi:hypothetical protein